ncbi:MAG: adenylosuccinate lyase [Saprospiraceae bacterium]|nr:adenylosuccinate lyase [Saprospiraceae bacterium]
MQKTITVMLTSISPIDGRYAQQTQELAAYFSEFALIRYRVFVEIQYFIALCNYPLPQLADFSEEKIEALDKVFEQFSLADAERIKEIERTTNHDVKAVEYFLREKFDALDIAQYKEFIHFGLTSQDVNNTATPLSIMHALERVYLPTIKKIKNELVERAQNWKDVPLLARTHGQAASPTTLGKEIQVFVERIDNQLILLKQISHKAKFGGATGNFNAHVAAYPLIDWRRFSNEFVTEYLGLERLQATTQIEHYDNMAATFQAIGRINTILIDFCRDVWSYVSVDYFKQKTKAGEVGSSAMPHKVNPIDFENAEGNLGLANALFEFLALKLPISRLQRDLTDSTVLRNIGVPFAHTMVAMKSILRGVEKLLLNEQKLYDDLEANYMVIAEGIQTILRREKYPHPYDALKALTRGKEAITKVQIGDFIENLEVSEDVKEELRQLTPHTYIGYKI